MSGCRFPKSRLQAWLDGEAGAQEEVVRRHVEQCPACGAEVEQWRLVGERLRDTVDAALGEVDPLAGLARIRERIAESEHASWRARLARFADELWLFHRRLVTGVAVAAALGALCAPAVVYLAGRSMLFGDGPTSPVVVVESLEVGGDSTAVVLGAGDSTTLIWVEPGADAHHGEESF